MAPDPAAAPNRLPCANVVKYAVVKDSRNAQVNSSIGSCDRRHRPCAAAVSPSLARSRSSSPFQAAAHGVRDVLPGGTARPFGRRALLVDAVKELVAICHRDPGVAHPDVELALVFLVGALRELRALGRHPPCVVGFGSHRPAFCLSASRNLDDMPLAAGVCSIGDSARPIFRLACRRSMERNKGIRFPP